MLTEVSAHTAAPAPAPPTAPADAAPARSAWWVRLLARVPWAVGYGFATVLGWLAFRVFPYRERLVRENLARGFPHFDEPERRARRRHGRRSGAAHQRAKVLDPVSESRHGFLPGSGGDRARHALPGVLHLHAPHRTRLLRDADRAARRSGRGPVHRRPHGALRAARRAADPRRPLRLALVAQALEAATIGVSEPRSARELKKNRPAQFVRRAGQGESGVLLQLFCAPALIQAFTWSMVAWSRKGPPSGMRLPVIVAAPSSFCTT